jgi:DNA-binding response OmpR family regulator
MSLRVLIVEDHVGLCLGLQNYLAALGYAVRMAGSVKSALSCADGDQFDVLLIDLNLPDGTGWDLLRQLKARSAVRAIAMSGWGSSADIASSHAAGFMRHLVKPVMPEELTEAIQQAMTRPPPGPNQTIVQNGHRPKRLSPPKKRDE